MVKKSKSSHFKIRVKAQSNVGGHHQPAKGGKYRRTKEKQNIRKEVKAES